MTNGLYYCISAVFLVGGAISQENGDKYHENTAIEMDVLTSKISATLTSAKITTQVPTTARDSTEGISVTASTIVYTSSQKSPDSNSSDDEESISMMVFIYVVSFQLCVVLQLHSLC